MSHRAEVMASSIQRAVQQVISRGLQDPRVSGLITVTDVRVTKDLKIAQISVSILPEEKQELCFHGLKAATKFIRREAGELVETRQLPEFQFRLDTAAKKEAAILRELDKVRQERAEQGEGTVNEPQATTGWQGKGKGREGT